MVTQSLIGIKTAPPHHIEVSDTLSAGASEPVFQWGTQINLQMGKDDINAQPVATMFIPPTAGEQMALSSDSDEDKPGGMGIAGVMIHYIDGAGNEQTEVVALNGKTPVMTVATDIQFVNILHTDSTGGAATANPDDQCAVGIVSIYSATNPAKVYCCIEPGKNIDDSAQFMVPATKVLAIESLEFSVTSIENMPVQILLRANSELGIPHPKGIWYELTSVTLQGGSVLQRDLTLPYIVGPTGIVKATAVSKIKGGGTASVYWAGNLLPSTFLTP